MRRIESGINDGLISADDDTRWETIWFPSRASDDRILKLLLIDCFINLEKVIVQREEAPKEVPCDGTYSINSPRVHHAIVSVDVFVPNGVTKASRG